MMYRCVKILPVSIVPTIKIVEGVKNETNTVNKKYYSNQTNTT
jgi:hypothetical protein